MAERRPIVGFGVGGVLAAVVLASLLGVLLAGVDVGRSFLRLLDCGANTDAVNSFVTWWLPAHFFALSEPVVGPLCLLYLLPAMHIAPGRRAWWAWSGTIVLLLVAPVVRWRMSIELLRWGFVDSYENSFLWATLAPDLVFLCWLVPLVRSWPVLSIMAAATGLAILKDRTTEYSPWNYNLLPWMWHGAMGATLLVWAVRARRYRPSALLCPGCGYELTGLSGPACPECGAGACRMSTGASD